MKRYSKLVPDAVPTIGVVAVGYIRVAAVSQSHPRSGLDAQAATIGAFAAAAEIKLVHIFEDAGESAHNMQRPGLLALLTAVAAGSTTLIIVPDVTRLARNAGNLLRLIDSFARRGASLVAATEPWEF